MLYKLNAYVEHYFVFHITGKCLYDGNGKTEVRKKHAQTHTCDDQIKSHITAYNENKINKSLIANTSMWLEMI